MAHRRFRAVKTKFGADQLESGFARVARTSLSNSCNPLRLILKQAFEMLDTNAVKLVMEGHDLNLRLQVDLVIQACG